MSWRTLWPLIRAHVGHYAIVELCQATQRRRCPAGSGVDIYASAKPAKVGSRNQKEPLLWSQGYCGRPESVLRSSGKSAFQFMGTDP